MAKCHSIMVEKHHYDDRAEFTNRFKSKKYNWLNSLSKEELTMEYLEKIIYEENEDGSIKESNLEEFMLKNGVWALFGYSKETGERCCLNVGKSVNIGNEILYDIACLHYLRPRDDGSNGYINQFNESCGFKYKTDQVQEYLYPYINLNWHSFQFVFIYDKSDKDIEKIYANKNNAKYWRNGRPYGVGTMKHKEEYVQ